MRDIHKMCRICLGSGSREIFEPSLSDLLARDDLSRIAEKLRFVTMLKVCTNENSNQLQHNCFRDTFGREKFIHLWHFLSVNPVFPLFSLYLCDSSERIEKQIAKKRKVKPSFFPFMLVTL